MLLEWYGTLRTIIFFGLHLRRTVLRTGRRGEVVGTGAAGSGGGFTVNCAVWGVSDVCAGGGDGRGSMGDSECSRAVAYAVDAVVARDWRTLGNSELVSPYVMRTL